MWFQLLSGVFVLYLTKVLWRRWKYDLHKIPSPPSWPILGHTIEFMQAQAGKQFSLWMREQLKSMGFPKAMRFDVMGGTLVVLTDVDYYTSAVLMKPPAFPRGVRFKKLLLPFVGNDEEANSFLFENKTTPYVKAMRKIYATSMQSSQLRMTMPKLRNVTQKMIEVIESRRHDGPIDFQKLSVQFTLDTIGVTAMDMNLGGLDGSSKILQKIIDTGYVARTNVAKPFNSLYMKLFPNSAAAENTNKTINGLVDEWDVLTKEILEKDDPPEGQTPFWYALKTSVNPDSGKPLAFKSLRAELATVVVGGMDTTGHQLAWILAMLASNPHIVDKLLKELEDHGLYGENAREVSFEDLGELAYLTAVIKEGMRIGHIGVLTSARVAKHDVSLFGYRVPKGTAVIAPSNRSMYSNDSWSDPEVARPERWLMDEDAAHKCFKVFSAGPRDCVGQKLAMLEIRFVIVNLLTRYRISMKVSFDELLSKTVDGLVIEAKDGIWLNVSPREESKLQSV